jgi:hypothetical protein
LQFNTLRDMVPLRDKIKVNMKIPLKVFRVISSICITFLLGSCYSSVATRLVKSEGLGNQIKGKNILQIAWTAQGMDLMQEHEVYSVKMNDHWRGLTGKIGTMWPDNDIDLSLKFAVGTFDGQVEFLSGKRKGDKVGLQSWELYEIDNDSVVFAKKNDKKLVFALTATQYFMELVGRLKNAELVTYAGEKKFNGKVYDLVFVTWGKIRKHKKDDQYLLWINKETGLLEYCEYTVRDISFPGSLFTACIAYSDFRDIEGVKIPFKQYVFNGGPNTNLDKYLHRFALRSFTFDSFPKKELYPNGNMERLGDAKKKN